MGRRRTDELPPGKLTRSQSPLVKSLDRYLFRSVLSASVLASSVFVAVLLLGNVLKDLLTHFTAGRLGAGTFLELVLLLTAAVLSFALPMGVLTGVLVVLGRMSSSQEIVAMRSAGWGLARIARPILVFAVLAAAANLYFNLELGPRAKTIFRRALAEAVRTDPLGWVASREFRLVSTAPKTILYVGSRIGDRVGDIWCWRLDAQDRVVYAAHAKQGTARFSDEPKQIEFELPRGVIEQRPEEDPEDLLASSRSLDMPIVSGEIPVVLSMAPLFGSATTTRKLSLMTLAELKEELAKAAKESPQLNAAVASRMTQIRYAIQKSFASSFAVLAFALVGIPLGIRLQRRESSANLAVALLLAMGYYLGLILIDLGQATPALHPELLVWLPNAIFAVLGWVLIRRAEYR